MDTVLSFIERNRHCPELQGVPETLSTLTLTPRFQASRHVVSLIFERGQPHPILVAKIPRLADLRDSLDHEADVLHGIQKLKPAEDHSIPRLVIYQEYHGIPILLETAINGQLMSPDVVRRDPEEMIRRVHDWLLDIQSIPTHEPDEQWYSKFVEAPIHFMRTDFPHDAEELELLQACEQQLSILKGEPLPYVVEHGDLGHPNLILTAETVGVIDWELADFHGLIASDFFFFLGYVAFSRENANQSGEYCRAFEKAFLGGQAWALPHIQSFMADLHIRPDIIPALFLLCWLRYLVKFIKRIQAAQPIDPAMAAAVRTNRYYMIWKYTAERLEHVVSN